MKKRVDSNVGDRFSLKPDPTPHVASPHSRGGHRRLGSRVLRRADVLSAQGDDRPDPDAEIRHPGRGAEV